MARTHYFFILSDFQFKLLGVVIFDPFSVGVETPKLLETPNIVPYPIIYDERRLLLTVDSLNLCLLKRVTGQFKHAPYMVYLGA